ncbi:Uncharacterised protein [Legionella busanensis]|uniref:Uncharacterized protein n=1 Tax=Legionella busanensis TaxID=190655 RepID=A0A378KI41_9GAMM|nr:hypothetical protein [Legionella busanensis]STX81444.1 Uncharacterised protein [Legionella busanensis]
MKFQLTQLAGILKLQRPRKNFKEHEKDRLNPTITQIELLAGLHQDIPYIWAIDNTGNIMIGIEKPWLYPQAFGFKGNETLWHEIKEQLKLKNDNLNYGHPTLTPIYEESGKIISSDISELAFIGGELVYKDNKWIINNKSGRFRHVIDKNNQPASAEVITHILTLVSEKLREAGIVKVIEIAFYSKPNKDKCTENNASESLIKMLSDYLLEHEPSNLVKLTTFENQEYTIVKAALNRLQNGTDKNLLETLEFLSQESLEIDFSPRLKNILNACKSLQIESTELKFINK